MDVIGCPNEPEDFVVNGTCSEQAQGMCETLWEPNLVRLFPSYFYVLNNMKYFFNQICFVLIALNQNH